MPCLIDSFGIIAHFGRALSHHLFIARVWSQALLLYVTITSEIPPLSRHDTRAERMVLQLLPFVGMHVLLTLLLVPIVFLRLLELTALLLARMNN